MHKDAAQIIDIEKTRAELISMLQSSFHVHGDAGVSGNNNQTEIVSVVGAGGLGKTTLAKAVYDELSPGYDCRAFVSVGRNPDLVQVFTSIFFRLDQNMYQAIRDVKDLQLLSDKLREFLENKRYFIVIDDVWDINFWQALGSALHQNNNGSRVVKTTRNLEVSSGDEVYQLGPLSRDNSKKLFYIRLYGGEDKCLAHHPEEASKKILDKCGGVPLAIITMASLLVGKSREDWFEVCSSHGFYGGRRENKQLDDTVWILSLSYHDLPSRLKTCLLYLSLYPEDYMIEKDPLIWKWVAEGFMEKKTGTSLFQQGEEYFDQLINRNMIQAGVESEEDGIIHVCHVHDMVLDLICGLSGKENFINISNEDGGTSWRHKVRHIAHQNSILLDQCHPDSHRDISQLRTLVALGCYIGGSVLSPTFKLLRVLALESCTSYDNDMRWLEHLGKLAHLRYLGLRGTKVRELPEAIGALKLLQTLHLEGIGEYGMQVILPSSVSLLTRLVCLRCDQYTRVPEDGFLEKLTSLEELQISLYFEGARQIVKELGNLSLLRVLRVIHMGRLDESVQAELVKSLGKLQELQHLDLGFLSECSPASTEWDKVVLPEHLRHLSIQNISFPCVPSFINPTLLPNLYYLWLCVDHMDEAGLRSLGGLPHLSYLCIIVTPHYEMASNKQAAVVNIAVFFPMLRSLRLYGMMVQLQLGTNDDSTGASLSIWREGQDAMVFDSKAGYGGRSSRVGLAPIVVMPNLHELEFSVPVRALCKDGHATSSDNLGLNLECLPSLCLVWARLDCKDAFLEDVSKAEVELNRQAELHANSSALRFKFDGTTNTERR